VSSPAGVDPLVSLSVFGSDQSRAAVCAGGTNTAAPAATASLFQAASTSCSIPMAMASVPATAATSAATTSAAMQGPPPGNGPGVLPLLLGLGVLIGIMIALASGGGNSSGNLTPISPA
jgi:hypothetical protein